MIEEKYSEIPLKKLAVFSLIASYGKISGEVYEQADALYMIDQISKDIGVPYAVVGGIAASVLGEPRMSMDVDILVKDSDRETLKNALIDTGKFHLKKGNIIDFVSERGKTQVDLLPSGTEFGSGIAFPEPVDEMVVQKHGYRWLKPEALILMKMEVYMSERLMGEEDPTRWAKHAGDIIGLLRKNKKTLDPNLIKEAIKQTVKPESQKEYLEAFQKLVKAAQDDDHNERKKLHPWLK